MSTTAPLSVQIIVPGAELLLRYAEQLVTSAPADSFARMPMKDVNSAAFNIGHLSTYGDRVCAMLGRNDLITPMPYSVDLFKAGAPCLDQPGLYPEKDVLVATFFERQRRAIEAFRGTTDAALAAENPAEGRFKEMFPHRGRRRGVPARGPCGHAPRTGVDVAPRDGARLGRLTAGPLRAMMLASNDSGRPR